MSSKPIPAIRLKSNSIPEWRIEHLSIRPAFRVKGMADVRYHSLEYQAASWDRPRQVAAKVTWFENG